jgi:hypothetical protein
VIVADLALPPDEVERTVLNARRHLLCRAEQRRGRSIRHCPFPCLEGAGRARQGTRPVPVVGRGRMQKACLGACAAGSVVRHPSRLEQSRRGRARYRGRRLDVYRHRHVASSPGDATRRVRLKRLRALHAIRTRRPERASPKRAAARHQDQCVGPSRSTLPNASGPDQALLSIRPGGTERGSRAPVTGTTTATSAAGCRPN